jgi:hypothetical protein
MIFETVVYRKKYNGHTYVVEEVRTGRKRLVLKSMWKIRTAPSATSKEGDSQTSETFGTQSSTHDKRIPRLSEKQKAARKAGEEGAGAQGDPRRRHADYGHYQIGRHSPGRVEVAGDYRITDATKLGEGGPKAKYAGNIAAIKLMRELRDSGQKATAEQQNTLARYVGRGGIPQDFDADKADWSKEHKELKALLTPMPLMAKCYGLRLR